MISNSNIQPPSSIFQSEHTQNPCRKFPQGPHQIYIYEYEISDKIMRKEARGITVL